MPECRLTLQMLIANRMARFRLGENASSLTVEAHMAYFLPQGNMIQIYKQIKHQKYYLDTQHCHCEYNYWISCTGFFFFFFAFPSPPFKNVCCELPCSTALFYTQVALRQGHTRSRPAEKVLTALCLFPAISSLTQYKSSTVQPLLQALSHNKSGTFLWEGESGSETYARGGRSWTLTI